MAAELEGLIADALRRFPLIEDVRPQASRPFFVEFAGTPKSGKTTAVQAVERLLRRNGVRVKVLVERASSCPLHAKDHMFFNVWTACTTLTQMLEAREGDDQVVLVDRGLFDSLCWMNWFSRIGRLSPEERKAIYDFILLDRWIDLVDVVVLLTVDPATSLTREISGQLTQKPGSIMNERTLSQFNSSIESVVAEAGNRFGKIVRIDTAKDDVQANLHTVATLTIQALTSFLDEPVLTFSKEDLVSLGVIHGGYFELDEATTQSFERVLSSGSVLLRSEAEKSSTRVQPIPIAYFKHNDRLLLLRRRETRRSDRLHEKYAVWAGGHVRDSDRSERSTISTCLLRELNEELYLRSPQAPRFVGFVYDDSTPASRRHLGIVHEVTLDSPDVALGMDQTEFKETKGKSMSGKLVTQLEIDRYYPEMEYWSQAILVQHLRLLSRTVGRQTKLMD